MFFKDSARGHLVRVLEGTELRVGTTVGGVMVFQVRNNGAREDGGKWWTPEMMSWKNGEKSDGNGERST